MIGQSRAAFLALAVGAGLIGALGDVFVVRWTRDHGRFDLAIGFSLWTLTLVALVFMLRASTLGRAIVVFTTVQGLVALLCARFYFGEQFTTPKTVGAGMALVGLALVEWSS